MAVTLAPTPVVVNQRSQGVAELSDIGDCANGRRGLGLAHKWSMSVMSNVRDKAALGSAALIDFITRNIIDGVWDVGAKLPTERELERRYEISRNTLRKALKVLETRGLIVRQVGRGSFVLPRSSARGADSLPDAGLTRRIVGASPAEVMEVRLIIEPLAAELAATRATAADLLYLETCVKEADAANYVAEYEVWDGRLHMGIVGAAKNGMLVALYEAVDEVRNQAEWGSLKARTATIERRALYQRQHRAVVAALKDRNGDHARSLLRQHLLTVRTNLLGVEG